MLSPLAARKAEKLGYKNVKVFHAGLPAWKKAGHVVVSNISGIQGFDKNEVPYILIDLRPSKQIEQGHIPKAVALAQGGIQDMEGQFPNFKNAPIILYNQEGDTASAADTFNKISGWGYKQVSVLTGGFQGWEKSGGQVASGPGGATISYLRKLMPGEVDIEVFKALVEKPMPDTIILDVRLASEVGTGVFPNSKDIPLDELEQRLADIPKDKNIVIHCSTGARAEMAYNILKKAGLKVSYVRANVEFDKDKKGAYTISD